MRKTKKDAVYDKRFLYWRSRGEKRGFYIPKYITAVGRRSWYDKCFQITGRHNTSSLIKVDLITLS